MNRRDFIKLSTGASAAVLAGAGITNPFAVPVEMPVGPITVKYTVAGIDHAIIGSHYTTIILDDPHAPPGCPLETKVNRAKTLKWYDEWKASRTS